MRYSTLLPSLLLATAAVMPTAATAGMLAPSPGLIVPSVDESITRVDYRPYRHCHYNRYGRRWCHGPHAVGPGYFPPPPRPPGPFGGPGPWPGPGFGPGPGPGFGPWPGPGFGPGPGPGPFPSDIRLKEDIIRLDTVDDGLGLYRYRYKGGEQAYVGVMAQEVQKLVPQAVVRAPSGYLYVDYDQLGLRLMTWEEWLAR